eukprot:365053-Chlamydomonas_euryale.AAC.27
MMAAHHDGRCPRAGQGIDSTLSDAELAAAWAGMATPSWRGVAQSGACFAMAPFLPLERHCFCIACLISHRHTRIVVPFPLTAQVLVPCGCTPSRRSAAGPWPARGAAAPHPLDVNKRLATSSTRGGVAVRINLKTAAVCAASGIQESKTSRICVRDGRKASVGRSAPCPASSAAPYAGALSVTNGRRRRIMDGTAARGQQPRSLRVHRRLQGQPMVCAASQWRGWPFDCRGPFCDAAELERLGEI